MPNGATSGVRDSIQPSIPNLLEEYAEQNSCPTIPAVDEIATTSPERCRRITGRTARVTFIGPNRLVSICQRNCSESISSKKPAMKFPALFTSTSMRPNRSVAACAAA